MPRSAAGQAAAPFPPGTRRLLVVEGKDEAALLRAMGMAAGDWTFPLHGVDDPKIRFQAEILRNDAHFGGVRSVGVLIDAEESGALASSRARELLRLLGFPVPAVAGEVARAGELSASFFLLPDGSSGGSLETLQRRATDRDRASCVDALFTCVATRVGRTMAQDDKAWMRAYFATIHPAASGAEIYGQPPRIDPTHAAFAPLRSWLARL